MAKMMLEIPDELKGMQGPLQALIDAASDQIERARRGRRIDYERFEGVAAERAAAVERGIHAACLAALDVDAAEVLLDGELFRRVGRHPATYRAGAGEIVVERSLYRSAAERNGKTVNLVSLRSGALDDGWLPGAARAMAYLLQQGTSREAEQTARQLGRLPYSRSSFERVGHEVGRLYLPRHQELEETLIESVDIPRKARSVSVSLDRVSLPMEEPRPRSAGRPAKDAPRNPISRVYRMAYCGTVTLHDAEGEALCTIRYGTMPGGDAPTLCMGLASDVLALLAHKPKLSVSLLCDGAAEMWNLLDAEFRGPDFGKVTHLIDFWHALEKLSAAAKVIHGAQSAAIVQRWRLRLLNTRGAAKQLLRELSASGKENVRVGDQRPVHEAITYIKNNGHRMDYATARKQGLPIGSGNVEATCKSLVAQRMKRAGARWKTDTGEHIIHLRALALSDRWDAAMDLLLRQRHVKVRVCDAA